MWTVKVDWDNNGNFTGPEDDISADVNRLRLTFGRGSSVDEMRPASVEIELDNASRKYSRYNSSSPIYGLMLAGRPVMVEATHLAVTYNRFLGELVDLGESYSFDLPVANLAALDGLEFLRRAEVRTAMFEGNRVDQNLDELLNSAGWPALRRNHDAAVTTLSYWWAHREAASDAGLQLVKNELPGLWYMDRDGNSRFENRDYRVTAATYATITDTPGAFDITFRQGDLIDRVEVQRAGLSEDGVVTTVYTLSPGGRVIMPGSTDHRNRISFEWVGAKNVITPVAVTDYTANSAADGTGTDKTAQLTVSSFTAYGGGGEIVFDNLDGSPVYLVGAITLQVRATAVRRSNEDRLVAVDSSAPLVTGQPLRMTLDWNDDVDAVGAFAAYLAEVMSQDQPRLQLPLAGHSDAEIAIILGLDVSKKISLSLTTGLYPPGISGEYFVEGGTIDVIPAVDGDLSAVVNLWSSDQALGNGFRVSDDTPGGAQEYSAIAADAATTGARIWI